MKIVLNNIKISIKYNDIYLPVSIIGNIKYIIDSLNRKFIYDYIS